MNKLIAASLCSITLAVAACSESTQSAGTNAGSTANNSPVWVLTSMPENAVGVSFAKASVSEGETITLRGKIGGRKDPISSGSPVFTVMDLSIPSCDELEDDHCRSPWDYCCETPETIRANAATVQLQGVTDPTTELEALDEVIIVGTVGPRPSGDVLTVTATGVYVVQN